MTMVSRITYSKILPINHYNFKLLINIRFKTVSMEMKSILQKYKLEIIYISYLLQRTTIILALGIPREFGLEMNIEFIGL